MSATAEIRMARIRERLAAAPEHETALRTMLVLAHEAVRRSRAASGPDLGLPVGPAFASAPDPDAAAATTYPELVAAIHRLVGAHVPAGARILVVSKGDDALLVPGFEGHHFPRGADGGYAGHYPADGDAAVAHLESCRADGGEFLVLPSTAYWWLKHYGGLTQHLLTRAHVVHHSAHCLIFDLRATAGGAIVL